MLRIAGTWAVTTALIVLGVNVAIERVARDVDVARPAPMTSREVDEKLREQQRSAPTTTEVVSPPSDLPPPHTTTTTEVVSPPNDLPPPHTTTTTEVVSPPNDLPPPHSTGEPTRSTESGSRPTSTESTNQTGSRVTTAEPLHPEVTSAGTSGGPPGATAPTATDALGPSGRQNGREDGPRP